MHSSFLAFNSGEITPYLVHRTDIDRHASGVAVMENFLPLPFGGVRKRPGTRWLAGSIGGQSGTRLEPFHASDGSRYVLHFANGQNNQPRLTVYNPDGSVANGGRDIVNITRKDATGIQLTPPYWTTGVDYAVGAVAVWSDNQVYRCIQAHTSTGLNLPSNTSYWIRELQAWAGTAGTTYAAGVRVVNGAAVYRCLQLHPANTTGAAPGSGGSWTTYWAVDTGWQREVTNWAAGLTYTPGSRALRAGYIFRCTAQHVAATTSAPYTGASWTGSWVYDLAFTDPNRVQVVQLNDVAFLAAPDMEPLRLTRGADGLWVLEPVPYTAAPLLDENADETLKLATDFTDGTATAPAWVDFLHYYAVGDRVTVTPDAYVCIRPNLSAAALNKPGTGAAWTSSWKKDSADHSSVAGQLMTITASRACFNPQMVDGVFQISKKRLDSTDFQVSWNATTLTSGAGSGMLVVQGKWSVITYGTWKGKWIVQRSTDRGVTWVDHRIFEGNADRNVSADGEEDKRVLMRLKWVEDASGGGYLNTPHAVLSADEPFIRGMVRITGYTSDTVVTAETLSPVEKCTTEFWTEGAFSRWQGFPACVTLHERRLVYAGTNRRPMSLWLSKSDDLLDFETGTVADDGIFVTLAANRQDAIRWLASQRRLFVGTSGGEWVFGSETTDTPLTPADLLAREYTRYGSAALQALTVGNSVFFVERQNRRLRELAYVLEDQSYDAADLTRVAEHVTSGGITRMAWQQGREPALWAVLGNGTLLSFTYSRAEKVAAWARHTTANGAFRSVCVLRNESNDDEVFVTVFRNNGYHLEKLEPGQQAVQESGSMADVLLLDAAEVFPNPGAGTWGLSMPSRFPEGAVLTVYLAGFVTTATVTSSTILVTVPAGLDPLAKLIAGYPVQSKLTTLPLDVQAETGTTHGRMKRAHRLRLDLYQSRGGRLQYTTPGTSPAEQPILYDNPSILWNGWLDQVLWQAHSRDVSFTLLHAEAVPFTLRGAVLDWEVLEA